MFKKIILLAFAICFIIFAKVINAEILEKDTIIYGVTFPKGTTVQFYDSGKLWKVWLLQDQEIQGIYCAKDPLPIQFYESGKLKSVKLSQDQEIQGKLYRKYDELYFDEQGKLLSNEY